MLIRSRNSSTISALLQAAPKATTSVKGAAQTSSRRRNLTVREAEAMGARRPLTLAEAQRMRGH